MKYLLYAMLIAMILMAFAILRIKSLRSSAIIFGAFSAVSSIVFLLLGAPDVALAQAVIGCTISTVIFLSGIKKYRSFMVCALPCSLADELEIHGTIARVARKHELDPHYISKSSRDEMDKVYYDLGYEADENGIVLFGEESNLLIIEVRDRLKKRFPNRDIVIREPAYQVKD